MTPTVPIDRATVTLAEPPFLPFLDPRTARAPGLSPLAPGAWIVTGPDYAAQMRLRQRLMAERPDDVLAICGGAEDALGELLSLVIAELDARAEFGRDAAGRLIRRDGVAIAPDADAPLKTISSLVAEDFCLLQRVEGEPEYRLTAAALCFPSRWSLAEKIGHPLTAIHDPVPDYDATLARRVGRVFDMLAPERPVVRINWLMHEDPALYQPAHRPAAQGRGPASGLYLRTEHQTLRRLPRTGAVAFGIRTHVTPVEALRPAVRAALADGLAALQPDTIDYRIGAEDLAAGRDFIARLVA
ncbi:MAG: DUF3445 domain-containing protein [Pseudomonadota bacterium]